VDDAYFRKEYVELYRLVRTEFAEEEGQNTAIVRGSSGTGKSAFLQYVISRIRDEVRDVLVVRGAPFDHTEREY
jgi:Cdc6-like AAA superfamily ATPase